jgi:probable H4MPT-linked C1 transfer pathway protein
VLGLDIGGANLKAAHTNKVALAQPFALWKQPEQLAAAIAAIVAKLPAADAIAATMTGELCDCFTSKAAGVGHIVEALRKALPEKPIYLWRTDGRFVRAEDVGIDFMPLAASNWLALASVAGRLMPAGETLLVDMGSTTTDILALADGRPRPVGRTDLERLRSGELVYVGAGRTPLCALLGPPLAAEWFATTKDVYLLLEMVADDASDRDTADGRPATRDHARARVARMLCADTEQLSLEEIKRIALDADRTLRHAVQNALSKVRTRFAGPPKAIVVCGSGEYLARAIVEETFGNATPVISLGKELGAELTTAACAYAVALLMQENLAR